MDHHSSGESSAKDLTGVAPLLEQFRLSGRPEDFSQIVKRYGAVVYNECRRVTRDAHDAEDAAQLTFLAFAIELRSGTDIHKPVPWLQRVSRRQALKIVRSRGRRKRREDAVRREVEVHSAESNGHGGDQALTAALVRDAIDALPERYRLPLVLHYFGGLSMESIAQELGLTRTAVGTRLHRARKMVANGLATRGLSFDAGTLTRVMASLVPLAVVSNLISSASVVSQGTSTSLISSTSLMLQASSQFFGPRAVVIIAACASIAGTALGWRELPRVIEQIKTHFDLRPLLDRLLLPEFPIPVGNAAVAPLTPPGPLASISMDVSIAPLDPPGPEQRARPTSHRMAVEPADVRSTSVVTSSAPLHGTTSPRVFAAAQHRHPHTEDSLATAMLHRLPTKEQVKSASGPPRLMMRSNGASAAGTTTPSSSVPPLVLGGQREDEDRVVQHADEMQIDRLVIGERGRGSYSLRGRQKLKVDELVIAKEPASKGELDVGDGEVVVQKPLRPVEIGRRGSAVVHIGTPTAPGRFTISDSSMSYVIVRSDSQGLGTIQGWGSFDSVGTIVNNGHVIADGFDYLRSLKFASFTHVRNTIENPPNGTNGWYAYRGGRVTLPTISVKAGDGTYTWGESASDPVIDLVNSVRFTVKSQPEPAAVTVSLRTIAVSEPLDVPLPIDVSIFGLWEFKSVDLNPESMSFTVRYNANAANAYWPGESDLQLLAYTDAGWQQASNAWQNLSNHLLGGEFVGGVSYLAVAMQQQPVYTIQYTHQTGLSSGSTVLWHAAGLSVQRLTPEPLLLPSAIAGVIITGRRRRIHHSAR